MSGLVVQRVLYVLRRQWWSIGGDPEDREPAAGALAARSEATSHEIGQDSSEGSPLRPREATCRLKDICVQVDGRPHFRSVTSSCGGVKMS